MQPHQEYQWQDCTETHFSDYSMSAFVFPWSHYSIRQSLAVCDVNIKNYALNGMSYSLKYPQGESKIWDIILKVSLPYQLAALPGVCLQLVLIINLSSILCRDFPEEIPIKWKWPYECNQGHASVLGAIKLLM